MCMRAVVYARVSKDRDKKARSVSEQIAECQQECRTREWSINEVIEDNDIGASQYSSKKNRPGYQLLKRALKDADVLVAWESSRVTRNPWELEELLPLCAEHGVLLCYSGAIYDPRKPADKLTLRITGATNAHEVDQTVERVNRAIRHRVAEGKPHGRMPFGYKRVIDPKTGRTLNYEPDPDEAPLIREAVTRVLAGESLWSICNDYEERGVTPPSRGGAQPQAHKWVASRMRIMLVSPTYANLRAYKGEVTGPGTWEPIITEDEHYRIVALLLDPKRRSNFRGTTPVHLLSGIAKCGRCWPDNQRARIRYARTAKTPRYTCDNCGLARRADKIDEMATEAMISFLEDPRTIKMLTTPDDSLAGEALGEAHALRQRLESIRDQYVEGAVTAASFAEIESRLLSKIAKAEDGVRAAVGNPLLASLAGPNARETWEGLDIVTKRTAVDMTLQIVINPCPPMGRKFDPSYIDLSWKA